MIPVTVRAVFPSGSFWHQGLYPFLSRAVAAVIPASGGLTETGVLRKG